MGLLILFYVKLAQQFTIVLSLFVPAGVVVEMTTTEETLTMTEMIGVTEETMVTDEIEEWMGTTWWRTRPHDAADQDIVTAAAKEIPNNEINVNRNESGTAPMQSPRRRLLGLAKLCMIFEIIRSTLMGHFNILLLAWFVWLVVIYTGNFKNISIRSSVLHHSMLYFYSLLNIFSTFITNYPAHQNFLNYWNFLSIFRCFGTLAGVVSYMF